MLTSPCLLVSRTWYTHHSWFFLTMMIPPGPQPLYHLRSSINCFSFYIVSLIDLFSTCQQENAESFSWKEIGAVDLAYPETTGGFNNSIYLLPGGAFSIFLWHVLNNSMKEMMQKEKHLILILGWDKGCGHGGIVMVRFFLRDLLPRARSPM